MWRRRSHDLPKSANEAKARDGNLLSDGAVPPWETLPYNILLSIFQYASYPLQATFGKASPSSWLVKSASICRAFAEPALSALYYAPPLTSPARAGALMDTLTSQNVDSYMNYRAKIRYLEIEPSRILLRKYEGKNPIKIADMLNLTPSLRGLDFISPWTSLATPYWIRQNLSHSKSGGAPSNNIASILDSIEANKINIIELRWEHYLQGGFCNIDMQTIFDSPALRAMRRLTVAFKRDHVVTAAISRLPNLKEFIWTDCSVGDISNWAALPRNLESFELSNCPPLVSSTLATFLASHGGNLRHLSLNHNHSLNLAFLTSLQSACPKLETLKMDMIFYSMHIAYQDIEPKYDRLLLAHEVPSWPRTLQRIELFHLRKWEPKATESFLSSLVESSSSLPDLRHIDIKVTLEESSWRDRKIFRDKWVSIFNRVFHRKFEPPNPHLCSIAAFKTWNMQKNSGTNGGAYDRWIRHDNSRSHGTFSRVRLDETNSKAISSETDIPLATKTKRRSTRLRTQSNGEAATANFPLRTPKHRRRRQNWDSSDEPSSSEDSALNDDPMGDSVRRDPGDLESRIHVQGMCDVVRLTIDSLRPTEEQLHESDFLDEEISGDEDWNGDDSDGDGGYAW